LGVEAGLTEWGFPVTDDGEHVGVSSRGI